MLSTTTQYALRALVHLALLPEESWILGRDLADRACVPAHYLSKILLALRNAELVETTRGLGGGYRLARPADQIALVEIAQLFEGAGHRVGCLLGETRQCCDEHGCSAHQRWGRVRSTYLDFLTATMVADIA